MEANWVVCKAVAFATDAGIWSLLGRRVRKRGCKVEEHKHKLAVPVALILMIWVFIGEAGILHHLAQELEKLKKNPREGGAVAGLATAPCHRKPRDKQQHMWTSATMAVAWLLPSKSCTRTCSQFQLAAQWERNSGKCSSLQPSWHITKSPRSIICHLGTQTILIFKYKQ